MGRLRAHGSAIAARFCVRARITVEPHRDLIPGIPVINVITSSKLNSHVGRPKVPGIDSLECVPIHVFVGVDAQRPNINLTVRRVGCFAQIGGCRRGVVPRFFVKAVIGTDAIEAEAGPTIAALATIEELTTVVRILTTDVCPEIELAVPVAVTLGPALVAVAVLTIGAIVVITTLSAFIVVGTGRTTRVANTVAVIGTLHTVALFKAHGLGGIRAVLIVDTFTNTAIVITARPALVDAIVRGQALDALPLGCAAIASPATRVVVALNTDIQGLMTGLPKDPPAIPGRLTLATDTLIGADVEQGVVVTLTRATLDRLEDAGSILTAVIFGALTRGVALDTLPTRAVGSISRAAIGVTAAAVGLTNAELAVAIGIFTARGAIPVGVAEEIISTMVVARALPAAMRTEMAVGPIYTETVIVAQTLDAFSTEKVGTIGKTRVADSIRGYHALEIDAADLRGSTAILTRQALAAATLEEDAELTVGVASAILVVCALGGEIRATREVDSTVRPTGERPRVETIGRTIVVAEVAPITLFSRVAAPVRAPFITVAPLTPLTALTEPLLRAEIVGAAVAVLARTVDALIGIVTSTPRRPGPVLASSGLAAAVVQAAGLLVRLARITGSTLTVTPIAPLTIGAGPHLFIETFAAALRLPITVGALVGVVALTEAAPSPTFTGPRGGAVVVVAARNGIRRPIRTGLVCDAVTPVRPLAALTSTSLRPLLADTLAPLRVTIGAGPVLTIAPCSPLAIKAKTNLIPLVRWSTDRILPLSILALITSRRVVIAADHDERRHHQKDDPHQILHLSPSMARSKRDR